MTKALLPQAFWFRFAVPCPRVDEMPRPAGAQRPIARALADAPLSRPGLIESRAELSRTGWTLELFLPAQVLHGFDPDTNRRFGFAYQIADHARDDQFLGVGRDFPIGENPSLWATLELGD